MPSGDVYWTPRCEAQFRGYTGARRRAVAVVRNAVRRKRSVRDWYDGKRAMQGVDELVYELKVTSGDRLLVRSLEDDLCLVAIGDHDVTDRYARTAPAIRRADFQRASPAPRYFLPDHEAPLFVDVDDPIEVLWEEELGQDWLHFLSEDQRTARDEIIRGANSSLNDPNRSPYIAFLTGGAGTGKTALLLNLAMDYREAGWAVDFRCSEAVKGYLQRYAGANMGELKHTDAGVPSLVLLDDPKSAQDVKIAVDTAAGAGARAVIAAYDPLQWYDDKRLARSLAALEGLGQTFTFDVCYRQSANVVALAQEVARQINSKSSWRQAAPKVKQEQSFLDTLLSRYSDGLIPCKGGGRHKVYERMTNAAIGVEAQRLVDEWSRWEQLPELLVLEDRANGVRLTKERRRALNERGIRFLTCPLADIDRYRGLDFQGVWLFLSAELMRRVRQGELGLDRVRWAELRGLHIALTRAKDSTVIFAS